MALAIGKQIMKFEPAFWVIASDKSIQYSNTDTQDFNLSFHFRFHIVWDSFLEFIRRVQCRLEAVFTSFTAA